MFFLFFSLCLKNNKVMYFHFVVNSFAHFQIEINPNVEAHCFKYPLYFNARFRKLKSFSLAIINYFNDSQDFDSLIEIK